MEELPIAAGLQIIDADLYAKGIPRVYSRTDKRKDFDSLRLIEDGIKKLTQRQ